MVIKKNQVDIRNFAETGMTPEEIADRLNLHLETVQGYLKIGNIMVEHNPICLTEDCENFAESDEELCNDCMNFYHAERKKKYPVIQSTDKDFRSSIIDKLIGDTLLPEKYFPATKIYALLILLTDAFKDNKSLSEYIYKLEEIEINVHSPVKDVKGDLKMTNGYCVRCKKTVEMMDAVESVTVNGKRILKGKCPDCGTTVCRILGKA